MTKTITPFRLVIGSSLECNGSTMCYEYACQIVQLMTIELQFKHVKNLSERGSVCLPILEKRGLLDKRTEEGRIVGRSLFSSFHDLTLYENEKATIIRIVGIVAQDLEDTPVSILSEDEKVYVGLLQKCGFLITDPFDAYNTGKYFIRKPVFMH